MKLNKTAKLVAILAGLFLLIGFYTAEGAAKEKFEEKFEKTVSLAKDGEVILENISGSIEVKSWDKGEVKIEALKISKASTLAVAKENVKKVKIIVEKEGKTLRITTEYPKKLNKKAKRSRRSKRSLNVSVTYHLLIPAKASAKIDSISGSVDLEKIGGAVKVNVVSGKIELRKADKGADCKTVSGSLKLQDIVGDAYMKTVSGSITASRIRGSVKAKVVSGKIELREVSEAKLVEGKTVSGSVIYEGTINRDGRYSLQTHSGSIKIILPSDSGFDLEAKVFSGRIETDFDITISGKISKRKIQGTVNKGGAVIKLSTFSGNISLKKK